MSTTSPTTIAADAKALRAALARIKFATDPRSAMDIYGAIRLTSEHGRLIVSATRYEVSARTSIDVAEADDLDVIVSYKAFTESVAGVKGSARIAADGDTLQVETDSATVRLACLSAEDWYNAPYGQGDVAHSVADGAAFADVAARAAVAATKDETRPVLTAAYLDGDEIAGCDSYRLFVGKMPEGIHTGAPVMIPARPLAAALKGAKGRVTIRHAGHWATIRRADMETVVRVIDGTYPTVRSLIPTYYERAATVDRSTALDITSRIARAGGKRRGNGGDPARVTIEASAVTIAQAIADGPELTRTISAETTGPDGKAETIGLSPEFLRDALRDTGTGTALTIHYATAHKPVLVRSGDDLTLIMPIRLD